MHPPLSVYAVVETMDTKAYLKSHGWRGDGHSLDSTDRGIRRPLLVSKKVDVLGVGVNKHAAVSDQWWMRAFDEGLKNLGSGTKSTLANVREKGVHFGGLYGRFVKGETVEGTIESEEEKARNAAAGDSLKRNRDGDGEEDCKSSKRRVDGTDTAAGEQLAKRVESQTKAVVSEAIKRGLIPKRIKDDEKKSSRKRANVDESTYSHIFDKAGLKEVAAFGEGSSKSGRKVAKHTREKLQRELKRVARAHFISRLSPADQASIRQVEVAKEIQRSSKGELKQVEKYNLAAQKAIARASESAKRKELLERKQTDGAAISAEKAARYAERAAAKGVSVEDYVRRRGEKSAAKKSQASSSNVAAADFVVDTTGDPALRTQTMLLPTPAVASSGLDVVDKEGKTRYTIVPGTPIPLDPTIWTGVDTKSLPKAVRHARKEWMAAKRTARKGAGQEDQEMGVEKKRRIKQSR